MYKNVRSWHVNPKSITMGELFGEENFIAQFLVKANPKGRQSDTFCATVHDYLLCYARSIKHAKLIGMKLTEDQKKEYKFCYHLFLLLKNNSLLCFDF